MEEKHALTPSFQDGLDLPKSAMVQ